MLVPALLEVMAGQAEGALSHLRPLAEKLAASGHGEPGVVLWPAEHIDALITADRCDAAIAALDRLEHEAESSGREASPRATGAC